MIPLSDLNPTRSKPVVNYAIIAACIGAFALQLAFGLDVSAFEYGAIPVRVFHEGRALIPYGLDPAPSWLTLFSHMFLHGGFMHIIGNMLFLHVFGDNIEDAMGRLRYPIFYLLCGLIAAFSHALADTSSAVPMVGASGAISGVLAAYMVLFPRARIRTLVFFGWFIRIMELPAWLMIGLWFVYQLLLGFASMGSQGGGVAYMAHIGGFIGGLALVKLFTLGRAKASKSYYHN
jgi:membrane associated rhomboid family serine protease